MPATVLAPTAHQGSIVGLSDKLTTDVSSIFNTTWNVRDGQVVPTTQDVTLSNGAVRLTAVVLYADLFHSTELARNFPRSVAAKIVRAYLSSMTQLINARGGKVRSFDGDRVMGVFVGGSKHTNAAKCALQMQWMVSQVLRPKAETRFPSLVKKGFKIQHCVGVAKSEVFVVRGGVRGSNDLIFVGSGPNIAAKLSDIRNPPYSSYITWGVHKLLKPEAKTGTNGKDMWSHTKVKLSGEMWSVYRSTWRWKP